MSDNLTNQWILNNKKICTCCGITRKTVLTAIKNGAESVEDVNKATGTGSGSCGGKGCSERIAEILKEET